MEYIFETEHLRVRKYKIEDAESLYKNHSEEEIKKWLPSETYKNILEAQDAIVFYIDCVNKKILPYVLAVELKETGELIGDIGVSEVDGKENEIEIGYSICKKYSGKGYATELVNAMTDFAVPTFEISDLYGRVIHGNDASVKVLKKNGFNFITEEFNAEDDPYGNGIIVYKKIKNVAK